MTGAEVIRAFAPGKLILSGEHAVVYGHRAVAAAAGRGTTITLHRRPGPSGALHPIDERLHVALAATLPAEGVGVEIQSDLPMGCGMGSSAALAVALVRALAKLDGREASFDECFERGFAIERIFHGTPSGVDHTVSARGGLVAYRRRPDGPPEIQPLPIPAPLTLVVANTGPPIASTAEMVAGVRARQPTATLDAIGALTEQVITALQQGQPVGPLLSANHTLLQELGVSTPALDTVCRAMMDAGADGAKLAGAGGGGVAFAVVAPARAAAVLSAVAALGFDGFVTSVG